MTLPEDWTQSSLQSPQEGLRTVCAVHHAPLLLVAGSSSSWILVISLSLCFFVCNVGKYPLHRVVERII